MSKEVDRIVKEARLSAELEKISEAEAQIGIRDGQRWADSVGDHLRVLGAVGTPQGFAAELGRFAAMERLAGLLKRALIERNPNYLSLAINLERKLAGVSLSPPTGKSS